MFLVDLIRPVPILGQKDSPSNRNPSDISLVSHPRFVANLTVPSRCFAVVMPKHPAEPLFAANLSYIDISNLP